jgi:type IV pilus assembly protein PilM
MQDKPTAMQILGLELSHGVLRGAVLMQRRGKAFLERVFELPLEKATGMHGPSPQLVQNSEGSLLAEASRKALIATSLPGQEILVRQLEVKLKKKADIQAVLAFQAEPLVPYPIENAILDRIKLKDTQEGSLLSVFAVKKDHVQQHLDQWSALGIEPEVVSCQQAALAAFAHQLFPSEKMDLVLYIGWENSLCVLVKEGKTYAAQAYSQGAAILEQAYEQDKNANPERLAAPLASLNFFELPKEDYPSLTQALENMRLEIVRTVYAISKQAKGEAIGSLLLTGEGAALSNASASLCQTFDKPLVLPMPNAQFNLTPAELQRYAIPIGIALTALPQGSEQINFRQQEFSYPKPWKRYRQALAVYAVLCVVLAAAFYFMSTAYIKYREDDLRERYSELLQSMRKPYSEFEKEYAEKALGKKGDTEVRPINSLTEDDIENRLHYLESDLQSSPYYYPLQPNVPTVSDVLAWLATHPNVVASGVKKGESSSLLQIENFSYSMVKRPDQTKKQEKYQVKVEMEFSSPTPKLAREFHDALIAPNALVDPKAEVKWSTNRGLYRASFFLKDKTAYPSPS